MNYTKKQRKELKQKLEFYKNDPIFNFRIDEATVLALIEDLELLESQIEKQFTG